MRTTVCLLLVLWMAFGARGDTPTLVVPFGMLKTF